MTCPRCNGFLHSAQDEMRLDAGDVAELTASDCVKCANCGHRIYPQIKPALPMQSSMKLPKQSPRSPRGMGKPRHVKTGKGYERKHVELMERYYDSITKMRAENPPAKWIDIAKLISVAEKVAIHRQTVSDYYQRMSEARK